MRSRFQLSILLLGLTLLSACQEFIYGKDNTRAPTALTELKANHSYPVKWSDSSGVGTRQKFLLLSPTHKGSLIYTADSKGKISAFDAMTGKVIWRINSKAPISTGPVVKDNMLVVGTSDARVLAFNLQDGKLLWSKSVSNEVLAPPAIGESSVVVKSVGGHVTALARTTGETQWVYDHENSPSLTLHVSGAPVIVDRSAVVGFADGQLLLLNLQTNQPIWEQQTAAPSGVSVVERMVDLDATPIVEDGKIYIASYQGNLSAFSLAQGERLWKQKISTYHNIAASRDAILVSDADGFVWAFSKNSGAVLWTQKGLAGRQLSAPAVSGENVLVGDYEGYLHRLSLRNGAILGRTEVSSKDPIYAAPLVTHHHIYVLTSKGQLVALDTQVKLL